MTSGRAGAAASLRLPQPSFACQSYPDKEFSHNLLHSETRLRLTLRALAVEPTRVLGTAALCDDTALAVFLVNDLRFGRSRAADDSASLPLSAMTALTGNRSTLSDGGGAAFATAKENSPEGVTGAGVFSQAPIEDCASPF